MAQSTAIWVIEILADGSNTHQQQQSPFSQGMVPCKRQQLVKLRLKAGVAAHLKIIINDEAIATHR
jgi:hypothetical protein